MSKIALRVRVTILFFGSNAFQRAIKGRDYTQDLLFSEQRFDTHQKKFVDIRKANTVQYTFFVDVRGSDDVLRVFQWEPEIGRHIFASV